MTPVWPTERLRGDRQSIVLRTRPTVRDTPPAAPAHDRRAEHRTDRAPHTTVPGIRPVPRTRPNAAEYPTRTPREAARVLSIRNFVLGCVAFAILGAGATYALSAPHNPGKDSVDVGFLQDMRYHHDQAVRMALILLQKLQTDASLDIRVIAQEIVQGQQLESGEMVDMLAQWGRDTAADLSQPAMTWMHMSLPYESMPGVATDDQLAQLTAAQGADADRLFCDLMSEHHNGGIHMAEYAAREASTARVRRFAAAMVQNQETDIIELARLRPAG